MRIKVPVAEMDIDTNSGVIWINSPLGVTVLRIKCWGGMKINKCADSPVTHFDLNVGMMRSLPVEVCLGPDAERI